MIPVDFPEFEPLPYLRSPHAQTILGSYLPGHRLRYTAARRNVLLDDGDTIVLHDDAPPQWQPGDRTVLLIHGLEGDHRSGYMVRTAAKLNAAGIRAFRMDLRNCGAGLSLARNPYHAGRSADARAAIEWIGVACPDSPLSVVGFSLGGNIVLKLLGECPATVPLCVDSAMAINPAIDLQECNRWLNRFGPSFYDRYFARRLYQKIAKLQGAADMMQRISLPSPRPRSLREFDGAFTAPTCGFASVDDYYLRSSSASLIPQIRVPTCILASRDDPMIPIHAFERLPHNDAVRLHITDYGGHLGFIGRAGIDPDRRWMDWRVVDWVLAVERYRGLSTPSTTPAQSSRSMIYSGE